MSLSSTQIARSRAEKHYSVLGLAILQPRIVLACQINDTPGTDMVTDFAYDNVTAGSYSDVIPGQTVFIGSTPGAYDIGICRARKAWTADTAYIGEESGVAFANNLYVTVVDAFDIHPKHLVVTEDKTFMDVDIDYSDQHANFDPVPIMGGQVVLDVDEYPVSVNFPDVAESWVFDSTIASRSFTASDGVVTNGTSANPTLTISSYPTNGYVRVKLTATGANGKSFSGYRYVFVFDPDHRPISDFVLESCGADRESGGWTASVTLNNDSDIALVRFGGLAVVFSRDYYDGQEGTIGLYVGRENVWLSGWIWEQKSMNDPEFQPRSFDIQSAAFWMSKKASFPVGVEITVNNAAATAWTEMAGLTVDKGLFHFLHWRSTITQIMDVYLTDDTRYSPACESAAGTLWGQLQDMAQSQILAIPTCNHNGKLVIKVPYNLIPSADRTSHADHVMDLEGIDFERQVEITRAAARVSQVVLNGVVADELGNGTPLFSLSPGHTPNLLGDILSMPNLLLESQSQSNELAGLVFANGNNPYDNIPLTLTGNNRAWDIAPLLYGTVTDLDEYSGVIIPVSISYDFDHRTGKNSIEVVFEGETDEADAIYINGDIPDGQGGFVDIPGLGKLPPLKPLDLPPLPPIGFPPTIPGQVTTDCANALLNFFSLAWSKSYLDGTDPDKLISNAYFPCRIRSSLLAPTYIDFRVTFHGDAASHIHVYATSGGSRIVSATLNPVGTSFFRANFGALSDTVIDGFEIELDEGLGTIIESVAPGAEITSGTVAATSPGVAIPVTAGEYYAIDGAGGPWQAGVAFTNTEYRFGLGLPGGVGGDGQVGWSGNVGAFIAVAPGGSFWVEQISSLYGRVYFQAGGSSVTFHVADFPLDDNTGSMDYILRYASVLGRALEIHSSVLNNVCAP